MTVRLRQIVDVIRHRLFFVPALFVTLGVVLSQVTLALDGGVIEVPSLLETSVDSGRAMLTTIATGLITTVTLLLTLMLVAVQVASSQLSPRTLRGWTGDRTQQIAIGVVMGTVVFSLLVLRRTGDTDANDAAVLVPHVSVLVGVVLAIGSLLAVVRAVDALTDRLRIGSVASRVSDSVLEIIHALPSEVPMGEHPDTESATEPDGEDLIVEAPRSGWVQQIDFERLCAGLPEGSRVELQVGVGEFVWPHVPVARVEAGPGAAREEVDLDPLVASVRASIAIGDTRTLQSDIDFGIVQLTDIAVRALSPGVNDPNTARDIVLHLGEVLLALWERPALESIHRANEATVVSRPRTHAEFLVAAVDPVRRHGAGEPLVLGALDTVLRMLISETERRSLPGPLGPLLEQARGVANQMRHAEAQPVGGEGQV